MKETIYELAAQARRALARKPRSERVRVVSRLCEFCGKTHRMGLGEPRCTNARNISHGDTETRRGTEESIFGKVLTAALLLGCLSFTGCAHFYVSGVTVGAGETASDGKELTAGLTISPNPYAYAAEGKQFLPLLSK